MLFTAERLGVKFVNFHNTLPHYSNKYDDPEFWSNVITDTDTTILKTIESYRVHDKTGIVKTWPVPISRTHCPGKCKSPFMSVSVDTHGHLSGCRRVLPPSKDTPHINCQYVYHTAHFEILRRSVRSTHNRLDICKMCFGNWSE